MTFSLVMPHTISENTVSRMLRPDLRDVVSVHLRSFPTFFLSQMGSRFLLCLYQEILSDSSGIALVYKQNSIVQGFVAGTTEPCGFYKRLLVRRWHRFALASITPVLSNPSIVPRLLNAFRKTKEEPEEEGLGLLMSIAVDPEAQAGGVGTALVHGFLTECRKQGLSSVHLTTDHSGNERVNSFYSKMGFTVSRVITTPQGRVMNDYRIEIA